MWFTTIDASLLGQICNLALLEDIFLECFSWFLIGGQNLREYVYAAANNIIKSMFFEKSADSNLKELYFKIIREEINLFFIYIGIC